VGTATASWANGIGASEPSAVWQDPQFDPRQKAFHSARVIEVPTPPPNGLRHGALRPERLTAAVPVGCGHPWAPLANQGLVCAGRKQLSGTSNNGKSHRDHWGGSLP
jgi:hypothetical protein